MQKTKRKYGLTKYLCSSCGKSLAIIPDEFLNKVNPPCKRCQGWELTYNFSIYLLRIDSKRHATYLKMMEELS